MTDRLRLRGAYVLGEAANTEKERGPVMPESGVQRVPGRPGQFIGPPGGGGGPPGGEV